MMKIDSNFESGRIKILAATAADDIRLELEKDNAACTRQWFYFSLETDSTDLHKISIQNADRASFQAGWQDYSILTSFDGKRWFRTAAEFQHGRLSFAFKPSGDRVYFAYFVPYPLARQEALAAKVASHNLGQRQVLARTHEGRDIELLQIGNGDRSKKAFWIIGRQHPGETMAQWFIEGLIQALLLNDKLASELLQAYNFYLVPNMNPDGSALGNHRTNALGINLNRQWHAPSPKSSPEVYWVQQAMGQTGVDAFLDVHGDESIPHNFIMSAQQHETASVLKAELARRTPQFQTQYDYDTVSSGCGTPCCGSNCGQSKPAKATDYVASEYQCLSMIMELSFKNLASEPQRDWTEVGCMELGQAFLQSLAAES